MILHKFQLLRLLTAVVDDPVLSQNIFFKGGTCAEMAGYLDRFSVDLDFDIKEGVGKLKLRKEFEKIIKNLGFTIENDNKKTLFYVLKYEAPKEERNTLRLSVYEDIVESNDYKPMFLTAIDRLVNCQTIETMFANKLVAPTDRYKKYGKIAGRDFYDIHYFFSQNYRFKEEIIKERTGKFTNEYLRELGNFVEANVNETLLTEDLNSLLPYQKFRKIRKSIKSELLIFLRSTLHD